MLFQIENVYCYKLTWRLTSSSLKEIDRNMTWEEYAVLKYYWSMFR